MKLKVTATTIALIMSSSISAQALDAYYDIESISVSADGASYGPFPVAIAEDSAGNHFIGTYSMRASLSSNVDIGLPFTFNRECQYDYVLCELEFYGSETSGQSSYYNAYQKWRNAQSDADQGSYTSYMMANTLSDVTDQGMVLPFDANSNTTDVKVTDVYVNDSGEQFTIGYSSAPYSSGSREFARRAFIQSVSTGAVTQLLPEFMGSGGFSSAYKIQKLTDNRVIVMGAASRSYARNNVDYFNECYNSDEYDDRYDVNDLVRCPGFDTQAWAWDVSDIVDGGSVPSDRKIELATTWLNNNTTNNGKSLTYSANAFDMNKSGLAVGTSTFEYRNDSEGARQRAIVMTPTSPGIYPSPVVITAATNDIEDQDDLIYNTWALTISEAGIVTGNREFDVAKGRNKATEFFVYNNATGSIQIPLLDKKVTTTKQRIENSGSYFIAKSGANSRVYDANESGLMVGEVDDFDQVDPVYQGSPRSQTAFLYDNTKNQAWLINDLICSQNSDGVVSSERIRIRTARVINDAGVVLADGFTYGTNDEYKYKTNGIPTTFKLTPNSNVASPNDSPNCWESDLHKVADEPYERQGAATFWLWLFALPLAFIRRIKR